MSGRVWTVEERDAHAERMRALHADPVRAEEIRRKRMATKGLNLDNVHVIEPSVYDWRLDLGEILPIDLELLIAPPAFEALA